LLILLEKKKTDQIGIIDSYTNSKLKEETFDHEFIHKSIINQTILFSPYIP
jgi:hypothetical protein